MWQKAKMTREEALDELLKVDRQLDTLILRKKELRAIVLTQSFEARSPIVRAAIPRGEAQEATIKVMRDHGEPLTASEFSTLAEITHNAANLRLASLLKLGLVHRVGSGNSNDPYKWELAIHTE